MKILNKHVTFSMLFAVCLLAATALAQDTEKAVKMKDLPAPVQTTVKEVSKGATLRGLAMETENGKTHYEAELKVNGHSKDVTIDHDGKIVTIEEQVTLASLPAAVKSGILKQAGKGKILLVESITEKNSIVAYEAHVKTAGKLSEVKVDPNGNPIK